MPLPLFVFGTLRHDGLRAAVAGAVLPGVAAVLAGHRVARALDGQGRAQPFPVLQAQDGARAEGLLLAPDTGQRARLDAYERLFRYRPEPARVEGPGGPVEALVYRPEAESWVPGPDWDLAAWAADWAAIRTDAAAEAMALWPAHGLDRIALRYPQLEIAAASRLRARAQPAPAALRRTPGPADIESHAARRPYAGYFGVQEDDLRFRRFDGGMSAAVTRAGFVIGDAVTVLPFDPVHDLVMLVEQFRYGAWLRGDPNPWSLEPIAGRIDAGESPETAARREAQEEAGLTLGALQPVGRYYPSPGAVTEYILSYVGLADLRARDGGLGGLDTEAEDIRAHVLPFARLMELVASGEVENGPLLVSALWLEGRRDRLRTAAAP